MKKQWMLAPLIAAGALGSWVLLHGSNSQAQTAVSGAPPEVTVAQALTRQVSDSAEFTGRLQAVNTVQVQPRVGGFINSVHFQEGALVHKGDVPFATVDSVAATSTGTLYVATPEGALYRSAGQDWTTFVRVDVAGPVGQIQPAGREVAGLTGDYPDLHLLLFDGSGRHRDLGGLR